MTVWLGILELSTGKLISANAGHECPCIKGPDGQYEMIRTRHGFVIGGMDGVSYRENETVLEPGSSIFLYTDGVPEGTASDGSRFGNDRLMEALNREPDGDPKAILKNMRESLDSFVGDAEQFDDVTMMCMTYKGKNKE